MRYRPLVELIVSITLSVIQSLERNRGKRLDDMTDEELAEVLSGVIIEDTDDLIKKGMES